MRGFISIVSRIHMILGCSCSAAAIPRSAAHTMWSSLGSTNVDGIVDVRQVGGKGDDRSTHRGSQMDGRTSAAAASRVICRSESGSKTQSDALSVYRTIFFREVSLPYDMGRSIVPLSIYKERYLQRKLRKVCIGYHKKALGLRLETLLGPQAFIQ